MLPPAQGTGSGGHDFDSWLSARMVPQPAAAARSREVQDVQAQGGKAPAGPHAGAHPPHHAKPVTTTGRAAGCHQPHGTDRQEQLGGAGGSSMQEGSFDWKAKAADAEERRRVSRQERARREQAMQQALSLAARIEHPEAREGLLAQLRAMQATQVRRSFGGEA